MKSADHTTSTPPNPSQAWPDPEQPCDLDVSTTNNDSCGSEYPSRPLLPETQRAPHRSPVRQYQPAEPIRSQRNCHRCCPIHARLPCPETNASYQSGQLPSVEPRQPPTRHQLRKIWRSAGLRLRYSREHSVEKSSNAGGADRSGRSGRRNAPNSEFTAKV